MNITVAGCGYVGLSLSVLLSQKHNVTAYDINKEKTEAVNRRISPIRDEYIEKYLLEKELSLHATSDFTEAVENADYLIIATPTNFCEETGSFDCSSVCSVIEKMLQYRNDLPVIIKSTVGIGFTESARKKYGYQRIYFSPEFLRETKALYDNLYPSRIIVGGNNEDAERFAEMLKQCCLKEDVQVLLMNSSEAEAVKLFSNTYLAMRVAYINELDTFCEMKALNSADVIRGVSLDDRIGDYYNNPSFGYGGYCFPKDSRQLLSDFTDIPQSLITATVSSNRIRKQHIADMIVSRNCKSVGIYRLIMKAGSDNFRESAIKDVIDILKEKNIRVIIYEPQADSDSYHAIPITNDFDEFVSGCDIIIANRTDQQLAAYKDRIYTRDLFQTN